MSTPPEPADSQRTIRLLEVARALASDVGVDAVLNRVLEAAAELTDARYAALGVIDKSGERLERFLTHGVDERTRRGIGEPPHGRGILGELIRHPRPLRLSDVADHPRSYGFPIGHPPMRTFLGVPIMIHGRPFGNFYLTEKSGGEFDDADEDTVVALAGLAGVAIDNARTREDLTARNTQLENLTHRLEATTDIARALGGVTDLDVVLDLVVKRSRALVAARAAVLLLREGAELAVAATAGELGDAGDLDPIPHQALPLDRAGAAGAAFVRCDSMPAPLRGLMPGEQGLLAPLRHRGRMIGALIACDPLTGRSEFGGDDVDALAAVAASAATAVASAQAAGERERALATAAQLAAIVEGSEDAIYARDREARLTSWNRGAETLFGWRREEVLGRKADFLAPDKRRSDVEVLFRRVLAGEQLSHTEVERRRKDGTRVPVSITVSAIRDESGAVIGVSTIARDISDRRRHEEELRRLADTDPLTGLHNRRRFFEELGQLLSYLGRYGRPGAVLMIDLDNLKEVNDTLGHEAGDALIVEVGRVLKEHARDSDVVARLGGDEFVMALPEVDPAGAQRAAERLIAALRAEIREVSGKGITTTASVGVATFAGNENVLAHEIVRLADEAMYRAKRGGRDRFVHYAPD